MRDFEYVNPADTKEAVSALTAAGDKAKIIAGGIDLLGELKDYIRTPKVVVNLKSIPGLNKIIQDETGIHIGALTQLVDIVESPLFQGERKALAEAAHSVGTPQIRNVGTIGGNLCQRPRCWYYRDEHIICLKKGGTKCFAVDGENQFHAILGGGPSYIVHPSDCAAALIALNASVTIVGPAESRNVPLDKFFVLPSEDFRNETILKSNEIVTTIHLPKLSDKVSSHYLKIRHKESFDWALSGAAIALHMSGSSVKDSRIVLTGVAPVPWRSHEAEAVIRGKVITSELAAKAGSAAVSKAKPMGMNGYKIPLTENTVKLALLHAAGISA